jgi:DNA-binding CsgD family transcriptional regulator
MTVNGAIHQFSASSRLNRRQKDVLLLVSKGLTNSEIAQQLGSSERTVKYYVNQLLLIFDSTNRTELVGNFVTNLEELTS